jgi:TRAP-type C4-dicarboxylate transport system substrate-binding protein
LFHSERDALAEQFKFFAAEVDKRTQGRVQFKPHYSGALTSIVETLGAVKNGVVPAGLTAASFAAGAIPAFAYLEVIGGIPSGAEDSRKAMDALQPVVSNLLRSYGVEFLFISPDCSSVITAPSAAIPEAKANAAAPFSMAAMLASSAARVGFCVRAYS